MWRDDLSDGKLLRAHHTETSNKPAILHPHRTQFIFKPIKPQSQNLSEIETLLKI